MLLMFFFNKKTSYYQLKSYKKNGNEKSAKRKPDTFSPPTLLPIPKLNNRF